MTAAFAVPLAILVAVAGLEAVSSLKQITSVDQQTTLASASVGPGGLVQALQTERTYSVLAIFAATDATSLAPTLQGLSPKSDNLNQGVDPLEAETNAAETSFQTTVDGAGSQAALTYAGVFAALQNLPSTRTYWAKAGKAGTAGTPLTFIRDYQPLVVETYQGYTNIINALVSDTASVALKISDPTLRTGVEALYTSLEQTESQWQVVQDLFVAAMSGPAKQKSELNQASEDWGGVLGWSQRLGSFANSDYAAAIGTLDQSPVNNALQLDVGYMDLGQVPPLSSVMQAFTEAACASGAKSNCAATNLTNVELGNTQIASVVNSRATQLHSSAVEQAILFGALGAIGTVLGLALVFMVSRSVSRPLVDLALQAQELATTTLPATVQAILDAATTGAEPPKVPPVRVNSRDEVAGLALALDAVNKTAVELATGQAALRRNLADAFVNLGRRNQNLVARQLEYISDIELKEANPESLEELFRLDHLATRMRRNAESLLILAGSGPARQWSASVPAMDVARAASAEVEDYKRLRLHHFDPAQVTGGATTDLVHILAELIENALSFSPPGTPVDVYGRFLEGGYVIVVVDSGIGMSAADLETANSRLEGQGANGDVPGRYLGHFVAGRLASRQGIAISLQASHSGGLVARVKIPAELIEEPTPDLSAVAEVRSSAAGPDDLALETGFSGLPPVGSPALPRGGPDALPAVPPPFSPFIAPDRNGSAAPGHGDWAPAFDAPGGPGAGEDDVDRFDGAHSAEDALAQWAVGMGGGSTWGAAPDQDDDADGVAVADENASSTPAVSEPAWSTVDSAGGPAAAFAYDPAVEYEQDNVEQAPSWQPASRPSPLETIAAAATSDLGPSPSAGPTRASTPSASTPSASTLSASTLSARQVTPDLGLQAPLAAAHMAAGASISAWDLLPRTPPPPGAARPAAQARNTADGLRKLTRRVPGASLPQEDGSLRRATPTSTTRNPLGLNGALSQYLSATANENRPEKEQNPR